MARRYPEQEMQKAVARFLDVSLPPQTVFFHIPNGGKRNPGEAAKFKAMGVRAGVPDICIIHRGRSIFIELKTADGKVSKTQTEMMATLTLAGAVCTVCRSVDEVEEFLAYEIELEARLSA